MRPLATVLGIVGGLLGMAFAQLVAYATAIVGGVAAAFGSTSNAGGPLAWSLAALVSYCVGVAGGALAMTRPGLAAFVLAVAALGGGGATITSGIATTNILSPSSPGPTSRPVLPPAPRTQAPSSGTTAAETYVIAAFPFSGPVLLIVASFCAVVGRGRARVQTAREPSAHRSAAP